MLRPLLCRPVDAADRSRLIFSLAVSTGARLAPNRPNGRQRAMRGCGLRANSTESPHDAGAPSGAQMRRILQGDDRVITKFADANPWRLAGWAAAALFLLIPLVAMQFTREVVWSVADFLVAGGLIGGTGLALEAVARTSADTRHRAAAAVAIGTALALVWVNLAVGFIGAEDDPANLMFAGVIAVGAGGAAIVRLQSRGMARAMIATAVAQAAVGLIATTVLAANSAVLIPTAAFGGLWLLSAWLFGRAAARA
jgi:hypothetical protein